jgi:EAL domain-containing protein (putative c-di-GMP-specific phosphodiesterase class I)
MPSQGAREGLERALDERQFVVFYQPIHDIESGAIVAAEALLRARRPSTGEIRGTQPLTEAAEEGHEIFRIDSWMMRTACKEASKWPEAIKLHVNLSPREFEEGDIVSRVAGLDARRIHLEITETSYIERPKETVHVLEELRARGFELWLDDFGTGHSSITHVLHFPLNGIKVPATFVKHVTTDERSRAITSHLIALAHDLRLAVIAEGVEHEAQLAVLRDFGCDRVQGFLFSRPMAAEDVGRIL